MKVCDCRNIDDSDPQWKIKVMADDFKCGLCQMRLMSSEDDFENLSESIAEASDTINDFLKQPGRK